jgi:peptidoglycan-associated lipoprotein
MSRTVTLVELCILGAFLAMAGCAPKQIAMPISDRTSSTGTTITKDRPSSDNKIDGLSQGRAQVVSDEDLLSGSGGARKNQAESAVGKKLPLELQDIYFEYDSHTLRQKDMAVLKNLSDWLLANRSAMIAVEGHCDERGTTEYNLALGQKRAEAAKIYLIGLGVDEKRIKTVSYGKEVPLERGHSETAWQRNRRAHFVLQ